VIGQAIADGILTGAIIALGAIGVSFTLQIMRFANFAHSELLTWGAYLALVFVAFAGPGTPTGPFSFGWQLIAAAAFAALHDRVWSHGRSITLCSATCGGAARIR
jgi:branched-chain amino acid transport system permease protein